MNEKTTDNYIKILFILSKHKRFVQFILWISIFIYLFFFFEIVPNKLN